MGKAVLVMDIPNRCGECSLGSYMDSDHTICRGAMRMSYSDTKPKWCPLKPLPKRQELTFYEPGQDAITMGWNACIEEICGE